MLSMPYRPSTKRNCWPHWRNEVVLSTVSTILANVPRGMPVSELRLLLGEVLGQPTVWLLTHGEAIVSIEQCLKLDELVNRRLGGEPMAYLLGYREFYGRKFTVSPAVLIPRPETELVVDIVKASVGAGALHGEMSASRSASTPSTLDLGTGSGCIAISIALECPRVKVTAVDLSLDALDVATTNQRKLNASVELIQSDWFTALDDRRFDIIVSNPPYVAEGDTHLEQGDLRFEPTQALSSGNDGLTALRKIISEAPTHLLSKGLLALEHGYDQAVAVRELLITAGFATITQHKDIAGIIRVSCGVLP